jgi:hypothetical protein
MKKMIEPFRITFTSKQKDGSLEGVMLTFHDNEDVPKMGRLVSDWLDSNKINHEFDLVRIMPGTNWKE